MPNNSAQSIYEVLIQINEIGYSLQLDLNNIEAISFNYQISDVKDISSRQQAQTLALSFPYNSHNQLVFDNILSVNAASLNFDPNLRTPVSVLVDTIEVFTGYLQVTDGVVNLDNQISTINCSLVSGNINFWTLLGEGYISDMDFSEYNHIYDSTSQQLSWDASHTNGYFYPLIDYGYGWTNQSISGQPTVNNQVGYVQFNTVLPSQLYPATYVKTIWDKIFLSTGTISIANDGSTYSTQPFQYQSDFLNSELFENLLIPFTKGNFVQQISPTFSFTAGLTVSVQFNPGVQVLGAGYFLGNWEIVSFNDTTTPPDIDPYGYWDNSNFWYTNTTGDNLNASFQISVTTMIGTYSNLVPTGMANQIGAPIFAMFREFDLDPTTGATSVNPGWAVGTGAPFPTGPNGQSIWTPSYIEPSIWYTTSFADIFQQWNFTTPPLDNGGYSNEVPINITTLANNNILEYTIPLRYPIFAGERVRLCVTYLINNQLATNENFNYELIGNNLAPNFPSSTGGGNSTQIELFQNPLITIGQTVQYNEILPTNIKKKDFFIWIMRMFNLYIEPSKTLPNTLIIEPRDDYYSKGQLLDWSPSGSNKLDVNQDIKIDILSNTQDRSTIFTYKSDKDYFNSEYEQLWKQIYGYYRFIRDNQFSQSDGTIDVGFSPTPIVQIPESDIVIPVFDKISYQNQNTQISNTDVNIRIVQRNPIQGGFIGSTPDNLRNITWAYAYGDITTQTQITFNPVSGVTQSYLGPYNNTIGYTPGQIVKSPLDGNYYLNISQVSGSSTLCMGNWIFGHRYYTGQIVLYTNGDYYQVTNNTLNWNGTVLVPNTAPNRWQDLGTVSPCVNADPSLNPTNWEIFGDGILTANFYNGYPYVGHFDNPYLPTSDLNWTQTLQLFYDHGLISDSSNIGNNLINIYYANQLIEQSAPTSKMITCQMYLTPQDINQFYFNSKIYLEIDGEPGYYNINSIQGFDPSQRTTCTVELLTTNNQ